MRQVVHDQGGGVIKVVDVPPPVLQEHGVLVALCASVISSGTERAKLKMGEKSLVAKARARPDLAKKVIDQARKEGLRATAATVRDRLSTPQPLGYSACGVVLEAGPAAHGLRPGQLVAVGGAGYANHAEVVYVPATLCAPVPDGVPARDAAFATLGTIALHGIRQAQVTAGELVVVSGLGLIGQLAVRLLKAYGHPVIGVDPSPAARDEVAVLGVETLGPDDDRLARLGADAVLLCAATDSDEPVATAPLWCRDRGRVVVVGDVGLGLQRPPYYDREVDLRFSRSYGPGRYDPSYEEQAQDYPIGYVRWTEGRNLAEVLRLLAAGSLVVADLVSESYPLEQAPQAYERLAGPDRVRALLLEFPDERPAERPIELKRPELTGTGSLQLQTGLCGAGNFARKVLLPALTGSGRVSWGSIATSTGVTARHVGEKQGFERVLGSPYEVAQDPGNDAVVIATRHDTHAGLVHAAIGAGKHVFVEKPLALDEAGLALIEGQPGSERVVTGFNRRAAPATVACVEWLRDRQGPLLCDVRVNAGRLPAGHWADTPEQGGRVIGEMCHFIDLVCTLAGSSVRRVTATGSGLRSAEVEDTVQALFELWDGSSATISYLANGGSALPKERVELHWDGRSAVIDDFRRWSLFDGRREVRAGGRRQDKGHAALIQAFVRTALDGGPSPVPVDQAVHVTRASLAVVESLRTGQPVPLERCAW